MRPVRSVNLTDRQHKANPFPFYAYLRWASPVHLVSLPDGRTGWLVTRYDDVAAVLADRRFVTEGKPDTSQSPWISSFTTAVSRIFTELDESAQARFNALVRHVLTPERLGVLSDRVVSICHRQLWMLRGRARLDVVAEYARPIPLMVAAAIIGVPAEDWKRVVRWAPDVFVPESSSWWSLRSRTSHVRLLRYVSRLIRAHKAGGTEDPLGIFNEAEDFGLTDEELVPIVGLLLRASFETTANLIGNSLAMLLQHPDQLERLRSDNRLFESAVEELARFTSPIDIAARYASEDLSVAGADIPRGDLVLAGVASANRDHRQFRDPDHLDLDRHPNQHLSFGMHLHDGLTAPVARLVGQIAMRALLDAAGFMLEAEPSALRWRRGLTVRGLESLPVRIIRWTT